MIDRHRYVNILYPALRSTCHIANHAPKSHWASAGSFTLFGLLFPMFASDSATRCG